MPRVLLATLTGLMLVAGAACGEETPAPTGAADTGYGTLFDRLALEAGMPLLVLGDLTLAAETADVELPAPQARGWKVGGIERLAQHPPFPATIRVGLALHSLPDEPSFRGTLGFAPTDVDQWAEWFGGPAHGRTAVMTLRGEAGDLAASLEADDEWVRREGPSPWYRPIEETHPRLEEALGALTASEVAVVAGDAAAQFGRAPTDDGEDTAVPAALAPQRDVVGDLAGTDRLARALEGWARAAFVVLEPHQRAYFEAVEPVDEPLEPYQHLALAAVVDEAGQRTALVVVHHDEAAARTNAERLERNLAATGHADRAEVGRDGATVVVDWFREDVRTVLSGLQRLDFGIVEVAVPADLVNADQ